MGLSIDRLARTVEDLKDKIELAEDKKAELKDDIVMSQDKLSSTVEAMNILIAVLSITQEGVTEFIQDIVGMALQYVYGDEYDFKMTFEMKRNQPEVILTPVKDGKRYDPRYGCGVGVVDVCAFALRLALWALNEPRTAPVIVFDEPFRYISGSEQVEKAAIMIRELSEMLGLQMIVISSKPALRNYANKIFEVDQINGISTVTEKEKEE